MENPVSNDANAALAAEGAALREQAANDTLMDESPSATPEPEGHAATAEHPADNDAATLRANADRADNPEQKPPEAKAGQDKKEGEQKPPEKEPSKYEKAKQREADAWKKIQVTKAEQDAREQRLAERERQQPQQPRQPGDQQGAAKDERGFTAADYEAVAKGFDDEGDAEMAKVTREKAAALKQQDAGAQHDAQQQGQQQHIERARHADLSAVIQADPEYGDPKSPKAREMAQFLGEHPFLDMVPDSFSKAKQVLDLRREAGRVKPLTEENTKLKAEVARLTKLTSINGGSPALPAGTKRFEDMTMEQQRDYLRRDAEQSQMTA